MSVDGFGVTGGIVTDGVSLHSPAPWRHDHQDLYRCGCCRWRLVGGLALEAVGSVRGEVPLVAVDR